MVQKEKEIKANTKFLKQEVHLHRETDVSAFFVLVGVQYTCDVPEVRTDSVSVVSKNMENIYAFPVSYPYWPHLSVPEDLLCHCT